MPSFFRASTAGRMTSIVLAADGAAVASVGIKASDSDARIVDTGTLHRGNSKPRRLHDARCVDVCRDVDEGYVGRDAYRPQPIEHVEFRAEMIAAEFLGQIMHLIDVIEAGEAHRVLVERRINDCIDLSSFGGGHCDIQAAQRIQPGSSADFARFDIA